ncbi:hypothetical protein ACLB2K_057966 [Fragaria x ananassa]
MSLEIPVIPDEDPKPRSDKMEVEDVDSDSDSFSDSDQESDSDGSEEKVIHCKVCMKDGVHMSHDCPYLVIIREPKDTPIGKDYMIVCHCCSLRDHGHPDGTWLGCVKKLHITAIDIFQLHSIGCVSCGARFFCISNSLRSIVLVDMRKPNGCSPSMDC